MKIFAWFFLTLILLPIIGILFIIPIINVFTFKQLFDMEDEYE